MPALTIPFVFVNGTIADATQVNTDFNAVATIVNALDFVNIGPAGIYASQIKPVSPATATFGGGQVYTFPSGININGTTITFLGQAVISTTSNTVGLIINNTGTGKIMSLESASVEEAYFDAAGNLHFDASSGNGSVIADAGTLTLQGTSATVTPPVILRNTSGLGSIASLVSASTLVAYFDLNGGLQYPTVGLVQANAGTLTLQANFATSGVKAGNLNIAGDMLDVFSGAATLIAFKPAGGGTMAFQGNGIIQGAPSGTLQLQTNIGTVGLILNNVNGAGHIVDFQSSSVQVGFVDSSGDVQVFGGFSAGNTAAISGHFIYMGSGVPAAGLGTAGDWYLQTGGSGQFYYKGGGGWTIFGSSGPITGQVTGVPISIPAQAQTSTTVSAPGLTAASKVFVSVWNTSGTGAADAFAVGSIKPAAGSFNVTLLNGELSTYSGTFTISWVAF